MSATREYEVICDFCLQEDWEDDMVVLEGFLMCQSCKEEIDGARATDASDPSTDRG